MFSKERKIQTESQSINEFLAVPLYYACGKCSLPSIQFASPRCVTGLPLRCTQIHENFRSAEGFNGTCDSLKQGMIHLRCGVRNSSDALKEERLQLADIALDYIKEGPDGRMITLAVDGIARTTNSVEGWHHGLQSVVGVNGSV